MTSLPCPYLGLIGKGVAGKIKVAQEDPKLKTIYIIGGTMGVGKTTVCQVMKEKLDNSVFLDGDWCWDSHPFQVTDETKKMVIQNICFLLNQFIHCSAYQTIIFCWVMHEQSIIDTILESLDKADCTLKVISLICDEAELEARLMKDIAAGIREKDVLKRSISRMGNYIKLNTVRLDTSNKKPMDIADEIIAL